LGALKTAHGFGGARTRPLRWCCKERATPDKKSRASEENPGQVLGVGEGVGVLRLREIFTFVKFSLRSG
jgi:hypothetical protein